MREFTNFLLNKSFNFKTTPNEIVNTVKDVKCHFPSKTTEEIKESIIINSNELAYTLITNKEKFN